MYTPGINFTWVPECTSKYYSQVQVFFMFTANFLAKPNHMPITTFPLKELRTMSTVLQHNTATTVQLLQLDTAPLYRH
jgi:hypothetical protein